MAARLVELARRGLPLHRLAVTAPDIDTYAPQLRRVLAELLGPPQSPEGWAYNFSQGPNLSEVPLFRAALLPLTFIAARERREDLVSLLLSPYYGEVQAHGCPPAQWDRAFRERRVDQGWDQLRQAVLRSRPPEAEIAVLNRLDRVWDSLKLPAAPAGQWRRGLQAAWRELGFPRGLGEAEREPWDRLTGAPVRTGNRAGTRGADGRGVSGVAQNRGPAGLIARTGDSDRRDPGPGPPGDAGVGLFPRLLPGHELRDPAGPAPAPPLALRR